MKRSIWFWLCFGIVIVLATYFSVRTVMTYMGRTEVGRVSSTRVISNDKSADLSQIDAILSSVIGQKIYQDLDMVALNNQLLSIPGVRESAIRRMPDGTLVADVSFHHAVALWTEDGITFYPLSADGTIVNKPTDIRDATDIVFRGPVPNDITDITTAARILSGHVNYLEWVEERRWDLYTNDGIRIKLPESNPTAAINTLITYHTNNDLLNKNLEYIDLRDSARILVKPVKTKKK